MSDGLSSFFFLATPDFSGDDFNGDGYVAGAYISFLLGLLFNMKLFEVDLPIVTPETFFLVVLFASSYILLVLFLAYVL